MRSQERHDTVGGHCSQKITDIQGLWVERVVVNMNHTVVQDVELTNFKISDIFHFLVKWHWRGVGGTRRTLLPVEDRLVTLSQDSEECSKIETFSVLQVALFNRFADEGFFHNFHFSELGSRQTEPLYETDDRILYWLSIITLSFYYDESVILRQEFSELIFNFAHVSFDVQSHSPFPDWLFVILALAVKKIKHSTFKGKTEVLRWQSWRVSGQGIDPLLVDDILLFFWCWLGIRQISIRRDNIQLVGIIVTPSQFGRHIDNWYAGNPL